MTAESVVRDYYEALRRGEPLYPYFAESESVWKGAISTQYESYDAVAEALREQRRTTDDWTVESYGLSVAERASFATFSDLVAMAWTDDDGDRHEFETRWSGTLVPVGADGERDWAFELLHVSVAREL